MALTPEEEKKLREEIRKELENKERILHEDKQRKEMERRERLEKMMREKIREEEEEKYFSQKGYVKYVNHQGLVEWVKPEEAESRKQKRRSKKSSSRYKRHRKKRLIQIAVNGGIFILAGIILLVLYKFNFSKKVEYGSIIVTSNIPGSDIYLDGMELHAFTPDTLHRISPGRHYVCVSREGFTTYPPMASLAIAAEKTGTINFTLKNSAFLGKVIIESNLSDFDFYVDGLPYKMTNAPLEVPIGFHVFSAVKRGYISSPSYHRVLVEKDKAKTLRFEFNPEEEIGYLQISSNRQNGYIYLDNKFTGLKAAGISLPVKAGTYEVSIRENGYLSKPGMKMINLLPDEKEVVIFRSEPVEERQNLDISTRQPGAVIIINGNCTPFVTPIRNLALSPGSHYLNFMRGDSVYAKKDILLNLAKLDNNNLRFDF